MDKKIKIVEILVEEGCDILGKSVEEMADAFTEEQLIGFLDCYREMQKFYKNKT